MGVAELVQKFILVAIVPVGQLALSFRIPLILFMLLVGAEGDLELFVLVSDVSHNSNFRLFGSVVHNRVQIVKVVLAVICLLGSVWCLFLELGLLDCPFCCCFDVGHVRKVDRRLRRVV